MIINYCDYVISYSVWVLYVWPLCVLLIIIFNRKETNWGHAGAFSMGNVTLCMSQLLLTCLKILSIFQMFMVWSGVKQIFFLQLLHLFLLQRQQTLPRPSHLWPPCPAPPPAVRFYPLHLSTLPLCPPCPSLVTCPAPPSLSLAGTGKIWAQKERPTLGRSPVAFIEGSSNEQHPLIAPSTMSWPFAIML